MLFPRLVPGGIMTDEELLEQASSLAPIYVDGFGAYRKVNGVLRCVGFMLESGAQLNLIVSLAGAAIANRLTKRTLEGPPTDSVQIWNGSALTH